MNWSIQYEQELTAGTGGGEGGGWPLQMIVWKWMGAAMPADEADSERWEQMTNFTSHYLFIIQPFAI